MVFSFLASSGDETRFLVVSGDSEEQARQSIIELLGVGYQLEQERLEDLIFGQYGCVAELTTV